MTKEEWKRRYIARWMLKTDFEGSSEQDKEELRKAGEADFEAVGFEEASEGFEEDPEGAADESMSYYGDG